MKNGLSISLFSIFFLLNINCGVKLKLYKEKSFEIKRIDSDIEILNLSKKGITKIEGLDELFKLKILFL